MLGARSAPRLDRITPMMLLAPDSPDQKRSCSLVVPKRALELPVPDLMAAGLPVEVA